MTRSPLCRTSLCWDTRVRSAFGSTSSQRCISLLQIRVAPRCVATKVDLDRWSVTRPWRPSGSKTCTSQCSPRPIPQKAQPLIRPDHPPFILPSNALLLATRSNFRQLMHIRAQPLIKPQRHAFVKSEDPLTVTVKTPSNIFPLRRRQGGSGVTRPWRPSQCSLKTHTAESSAAQALIRLPILLPSGCPTTRFRSPPGQSPPAHAQTGRAATRKSTARRDGSI